MILLLGGTAEARELAGVLVERGSDVLSSLAGRVSQPARPPGRVRIGGFGGPDGLAAFLADHRVRALVDATHPYAVQISAHAREAAARTGVPLIRLVRPSWREHPGADRWTWVGSPAEALEAGAGALRPFLTTGRQTLAAFRPWADRAALVRVVDPPDTPLPDRWWVVRSRGPYGYDDERRLMLTHGVDLLVTKDSGGTHTAAKLAAAGDLGVPVLVLARPDTRPGYRSVAEVLARLDAIT